ncbi:hypothetical protein [Microcoleus sp. LEGE 07076]
MEKMFVGRVGPEKTAADKMWLTALVKAANECQTCSQSRFE